MEALWNDAHRITYQNPLQSTAELLNEIAANYLAFIQLASIRPWLRANEFTP
jgi:hypothetical protein